MTKVIRELPAIEAETTPPSKKQDIKMDTTVEVTAAENAATAKERERISGISALDRKFVNLFLPHRPQVLWFLPVSVSNSFSLKKKKKNVFVFSFPIYFVGTITSPFFVECQKRREKR
jgi:hypothetical protein